MDLFQQNKRDFFLSAVHSLVQHASCFLQTIFFGVLPTPSLPSPDQLRNTEMFASARNIRCVTPRCVQVCKCKEHHLRNTEMCASVQVQETSLA